MPPCGRHYARDLGAQVGREEIDRLLPAGEKARWLQHRYLVDNPHPLGERDRLVDSGAGDAYDLAHIARHRWLKSASEFFGYDDVYLIERDTGTVIYSGEKRIDFGADLFGNAYADSPLASAARLAMGRSAGETSLSDYGLHATAGDTPVAFMATPVFLEGEMVGALAVKLHQEKVAAIMSSAIGLGDTGEAMLLGRDGRMRSQAQRSAEPTILSRSVDTRALALANERESGVFEETVDGVRYLTAYRRLGLDDVGWLLLGRKDVVEVNAGATRLMSIISIIMLVSVSAVGLFAWFFARGLHRTLGGEPAEIRDLARRMEGGDLSARDSDLDRHGAFGELVAMRARLQEIMDTATVAAERVREGAGALAEGNRGLSERTEQQGCQHRRDRLLHRGAHQHGQEQLREPPLGQRAGHRHPSARHHRWGGRLPRRRRHGRDQRLEREDRRHHRRDQRDRLPDQSPRPQRRRRGRPRRRAGARLRRRRQRGPPARRTQRLGGQGDQGPDRGQRGKSARRAPRW